jgi:hypothetical protein
MISAFGGRGSLGAQTVGAYLRRGTSCGAVLFLPLSDPGRKKLSGALQPCVNRNPVFTHRLVNYGGN